MAIHIATAVGGLAGVTVIVALLLSDVKRWNYSLIRRSILADRKATLSEGD